LTQQHSKRLAYYPPRFSEDLLPEAQALVSDDIFAHVIALIYPTYTVYGAMWMAHVEMALYTVPKEAFQFQGMDFHAK
jgi:hypothetical protein